LLKDGMQLDLGGIGQGYAADEAYQMLKDRGLTRALVDISGDFRAGDPPPDRSGWRIEIEALKPKSANAEHSTARTLLISNAAVSTSGDAYNFVEIDGQRYSHIVDPKTGLGLATSCSVTIIARDAITADALDTAVCVLGVGPGLDTIRNVEGAEALFARLNGDEIQITETKGFMSYIENE
jgi:thiamine biosynthesis lipoprotein